MTAKCYRAAAGLARPPVPATGREIVGEPVHETVNTWVYNIEDDTDDVIVSWSN